MAPSQTLTNVFAMAERYALWDDDWSTAKEPCKQVDQPQKEARLKNVESYNGRKCKSRPTEGDFSAGKTYIEFTISINQILHEVKDKPWQRRPLPLKSNHATRDTSKYYALHITHGYYIGDYKAWKKHLEELIKKGHCCHAPIRK